MFIQSKHQEIYRILNKNPNQKIKRKWKKYEFPWYMNHNKIPSYPYDIIFQYPPYTWILKMLSIIV